MFTRDKKLLELAKENLELDENVTYETKNNTIDKTEKNIFDNSESDQSDNNKSDPFSSDDYLQDKTYIASSNNDDSSDGEDFPYNFGTDIGLPMQIANTLLTQIQKVIVAQKHQTTLRKILNGLRL